MLFACSAIGRGFESRNRHKGCCKCIVPSRYGGTLNSHTAESPQVKLVEEEERCEAPTTPRVFSQNWGEAELNRFVTRMVLKATANDMHPLALCHDEFRGP
ncbi:uncharacterized protein TNCV_1894201 [Trichonephila clavipes]|nr:uncharacterized protein TNCV_1894201 [Trichonephila clavipes]